ncbi:ATP-binding cassette domain-containing protein [Streptococcus infantarius]|uniref:ATP-binding cassette domain-containing protein n=1 Tax=Streptococcus infantarius TaxID=102684 RepID=UPI002FD85C12
MSDKLERHPQSLSGREKQRLLLAMAKASNKPIIVLDEPTSGLCHGQRTNDQND